MKTCKKCLENKPLDCFKKQRNTHLGHCKSCEAVYHKQWMLENKDSVKEYAKQYGVVMKASRRLNPIACLIRNARYRSKISGVPFTITINDLVIPEFCPVFGFKLEVTNDVPGDCSPSLDRIIPELGYVKGNVQIISNLANRMKSNASPEQLKLFAKWIVENNN